ncbi:MAG: hypothetical protein GQ574_05360 [Crocinitomix sp.]|nr:hypothetical protein [Crocinitomix sp.]
MKYAFIPRSLLKIICLFLLVFFANNLRAQTTYDNYKELETSNELQYKVLSLKGQGVLIMASGTGVTEGKTIVNYTLLDNDLNVRNQSDLVYESEVYFNAIEVDSGVAYLFFTNNYGDCQFEKFDLINATSSQFTFNLKKIGDIIHSDLSLDNPYIIRNHADLQYSITQFDFELKEYKIEFIDVGEMRKPLQVLDSKIDESGENYLILFKNDNSRKYDIHLVKKNIESGEQETTKLTRKGADQSLIHPLADCGFDKDEVYVISNFYQEYYSVYHKNVKEGGISYQRFTDGVLRYEKKYTSEDFDDYNNLLKKTPLKGIIPNATYRTMAIPVISKGQLIARANGHSLFIGYVYFSPEIYRLFPSEYDGRLYQMIVNFDNEGNIVWDRQIKMHAFKEDDKFNDNYMNIVYSDADSVAYTGILNFQNARLSFNELNAAGRIFPRKYNQTIVKYHPKNKVKSSHSKIIYLYDRTFLHYGIQLIKNKSRGILDYKYVMMVGTFEL